jgi:hypothetical protein
MSNPKPEVSSTIEFSNPNAWHLAALLNRVGRSAFRSHTVSNDEVPRMRAAADTIWKPLTDSRYSPR